MSGDYSAVVITRFVDSPLVASWLPEGLALAAECPFEKHPVLIMLGRQRNLSRQRYFRVYPRWGDDYLETFIAVPYLKLRGQADKPPVFHFVRVYLDNWPATEKGIELYGWRKICTRLRYRHGRDYRIFFREHGQILAARTDLSLGEPVSEDNPSLVSIRQMLRPPMVLRKDGCLNTYRFDLHLDCARIRSVPTHISIHDGFLPGLPADETHVAGINDAEFGAFYMNTYFTSTRMPY
jgi:hypothetical protein